ncbi:MAG: hypothetical protein CMH60_06990 [Myxococcales bacterium]|nr:hypothetical protein [Myxococcales bacterium]
MSFLPLSVLVSPNPHPNTNSKPSFVEKKIFSENNIFQLFNPSFRFLSLSESGQSLTILPDPFAPLMDRSPGF